MKIEFITSPIDAQATGALQVVLPKEDGPLPQSHLKACIAAAKKTGASLCTAPFEKDDRIVMAYIGPEGTIEQAACFLPKGMKNFKVGSDVTVFETPFGRMAMACGLDSLQPQYARAAALKGCQLLVCGLWLPGHKHLMAGPWSGSQANCIAMAVAQPNDGQLVLPCVLTKNLSGLGRGSFEPNELAAAYKKFPVFDCMDPALAIRYEEVLLK